ncbi:MAG: peptidoglycan DD-metalloendopeptidase family protein [Solirubrobacterales bacterium]
MAIRNSRLRTSAIFTAFAIALSLTVVISSSSPARAESTGGSNVEILPKITEIVCTRACAHKKSFQAGSTLRISGENLDVAKQIVFLGSRGPDDDVVASVASAKTRKAKVVIPAGAVSGPIIAATAAGDRSRQTRAVAIRPMPPVIGSPDLQAVGGVAIPGVTFETGTSTPRVVFTGAKQLVRYSLRVNGIDSANATVSLTKQSTGVVAASWNVAVPAGQVVSVDWDGLSAGKPAASGRYVFTAQVHSGGTVAAAASAPKIASTGDRDAFDLYGFIFPVRGKHNFGQYAASFGGGRGHQGQDVMSRCGTKLVAARGGTVIQSRFQGAAGNFIAIRPDFGIGDQAYLHMASTSPFKPGDRVYTGQIIGNVGQTGRASGCHLHFERWTGEIWRSKPVDPLPDLLAWDQVS